MKPLDARQMLAIQVSERTMSVLSILGSFFIIATFLKWHYFRKPINRLVFFASFGNMMANMATLISTSALPASESSLSSLCEFQAVLIQWFMMADSLWVFCMALNVMLVFFHGYNSRQLRHLELYYMLFSYGLPGTVAIIFIILNHAGRHNIFGPATIWCWISSEVAWMRLAFFYGPVWVLIILTLLIYIVTGLQIFKKRAELRQFSKPSIADQELGNTVDNPFHARDLGNIKVETEMKIESHVSVAQVEPGLEASSPVCLPESRRSSFASTRQLSGPTETPMPTTPLASSFSHVSWGATPPQASPERSCKGGNGTRSGYRATAFSTNQARSMEATPSRSTTIRSSNRSSRRTGGTEGNAAAWGYAKVAFLMFAALFIVWVPSTINRLQQFFHQDNPIFGLNLASSLVLPLQGFWNSMIYMSTTWAECKCAFGEVLDMFSTSDNVGKRTSYGRGSVRTLSSSEDQEFGTRIPLEPAASSPESRRSLESSMSSTETVRASVTHPEK